MRLTPCFLAATATALAAVPAQADAAALLFTLTGDQTASFTLDQNPVPDTVFSDEFRLDGISGTLNGSNMTFDTLTFFKVNAFGGFAIDYFGGSLLTEGPSVFTGTTSNPTFVTGTYNLTGFDTTQGNFTLTISAVPEASTWAMMLVGFGAIGYAFRRSRRATPKPASI